MVMMTPGGECGRREGYLMGTVRVCRRGMVVFLMTSHYLEHVATIRT